MDNECFVPSLLTEKVKLSPKFLNKQYKQKILHLLKQKNEGRCSKHGYIKHDSIQITKISTGVVEAHTLHGFVNYVVQFKALVCNPTNGSILKCKIINSNNFGILCTSGIYDADGTYHIIMDIIVPKNSAHIRSDTKINIDDLQEGQIINVEIVGKKYEMSDTKISAVGRIVHIDETEAVNASSLFDVENNEDVEETIPFEEIYEDDFDNGLPLSKQLDTDKTDDNIINGEDADNDVDNDADDNEIKTTTSIDQEDDEDAIDARSSFSDEDYDNNDDNDT